MPKMLGLLLKRMGCIVHGHNPCLSIDLLRGPVSRCRRCGLAMHGKVKETYHVRLR
ncbi:MAG: hypothetical protein MUP21_13415 [Dehalococcoidia bacterium]|nr:hypothetical protein [Dehalococcoidia bacterium]